MSHLRSLLALAFFAACHTAPTTPTAPLDEVGRREDGSTMTPVNQTLTPHGVSIDLGTAIESAN